MSGRLKISFAADMPPASVEVVAPDYTTVGRLYLAPGENKSVDEILAELDSKGKNVEVSASK